MLTLTSRYLSLTLVLLAAVASNAQDLHIKKSITVGGNFVSSTETSIKGPRERTVSQSPNGSLITIRQCDLKRTISVNEQQQTYFILKDPQDDAAAKAAAMVSGVPQSDSGGFITETSTLTDTGERKTLYGYPARHLKATVTLQSSQNACSQLSQQYEVDGWYGDVSKDLSTSCQQFLPPVRQGDGCNDRVVRKRSGSAKPGYPIVENITLHNADGTTTQLGVQTSEITKSSLEKELFDVPPGFHEVKSVAELNGPPKPQGDQPMMASTAPVAAPQAMPQAMRKPAPQARSRPPAKAPITSAPLR